MATPTTNLAPAAHKFNVTERYNSVLPEIKSIMMSSGVSSEKYDACCKKAHVKVTTDPKYAHLNVEEKKHKYEMIVFGWYHTKYYPTAEFPGQGPKIIDTTASTSTATRSTGKEHAGPRPGMAQGPPTYSNVLTRAPTGVKPNFPTPEQRRLEAEAIWARRNEHDRAKNRGAPLLPLQSDGLPQFSVVPSFSKPRPEDLFIGKNGQYVRYVQVHWDDVLLRSGHFNGKFVVWAEPKREEDIASLPATLPSAKRFLEAWNHRAKESKKPVTLRDYFMDWQEADIRDEMAAKYQSPNPQPATQRGSQEDISSWMQTPNASASQIKDQETTTFEVPEKKYARSVWMMEEGLAIPMLQQDGYIDPMEYKSRRIIYDTVTEDFMPLCEYEALLKERWREESKEIEDMETQSLVANFPDVNPPGNPDL